MAFLLFLTYVMALTCECQYDEILTSTVVIPDCPPL